jgi:ATP-binding cassette subfamily B protein
MIAQKQINGFRRLMGDIKGLRRLWPFLQQNRRNLIIALIMVPVISLLQMSLPLIVKRTIDQGISPGIPEQIYWGIGIGALVVIAEYISRAIQTLVTAQAIHRMIRNMREFLIRHVLHLSPRFHDQALSGALVTRATSDFDNLSESLNQGVLTSVVDLAVLTGALIGLFVLNWRLALSALVILPIVTVIVVTCSRILKRTMLAARVKIAALNGFTQECLYGAGTVKTLTAEAQAQNRFEGLAKEYRQAQMKSVMIDAALFALLDGISSITIGVVLWVAVNQITAGNSGLTAGIMVAFVQYIQNLFDPLKQLGNKIAMLQGAFTSLERIFGILEKEDFVAGELPPRITRGHIQFQNVTFRYDPEARQPTLNEVSFDLPAGKSLALVGATGSGKSTIIKLLCKLYDGYQGSIQIDRQNLQDLDPEEIRRQIALVPQEIVLFEGTLLFNITLNHPDVSHEQAIEAARIVGANQFIRNLPGGFDFEIKEGGLNLSQGQRQLLAFARALARNPRVIVLDEATSSVDPQSEAAIQRAIDRILHGRTVIIIAHRLSTIKRCEQIILLNQGRILERGSHADLMKDEAHYYRLHHSLVD